MIVIYHDHQEGDYHHDLRTGDCYAGCIGPEVEREPDEKPRRPIGFRMPEPEIAPEDPSWMLL